LCDSNPIASTFAFLLVGGLTTSPSLPPAQPFYFTLNLQVVTVEPGGFTDPAVQKDKVRLLLVSAAPSSVPNDRAHHGCRHLRQTALAAPPLPPKRRWRLVAVFGWWCNRVLSASLDPLDGPPLLHHRFPLTRFPQAHIPLCLWQDFGEHGRELISSELGLLLLKTLAAKDGVLGVFPGEETRGRQLQWLLEGTLIKAGRVPCDRRSRVRLRPLTGSADPEHKTNSPVRAQARMKQSARKVETSRLKAGRRVYRLVGG
jgi:hypothetical protein